MRHGLVPAVVAFCLTFPSPSRAGSRSAFFNQPSGARPVALAGSYAAVADDASSLSTNPAGLLLAGNSVEFSHNRWPIGAVSEHVVATLNLQRFGCYGAGFHYYMIPTGALSASSIATTYASYGSIGWASPMGPLLAGTSLKLLFNGTQEQPARGMAADFGLMTRGFTKNWNLGIAVQNVGLTVAQARDDFEMPLIFRAGTSFAAVPGRLTFSGELDMPYDDGTSFGFGAETNMGHVVYPRIGWRYNEIENPWTVGVGVKFSYLTVDLARQSETSGAIYRGSVAVHFDASGPGPAPRKRDRTIPIRESSPAARVVLGPPPEIDFSEEPTEELPAPNSKAPGLARLQCKPDPFKSGGTYIYFDLGEDSEAVLKVYNGGKYLRTMKLGGLEAGKHQVYFDARDDQGESIPPGDYGFLVNAKANGKAESRYSFFKRIDDEKPPGKEPGE